MRKMILSDTEQAEIICVGFGLDVQKTSEMLEKQIVQSVLIRPAVCDL